MPYNDEGGFGIGDVVSFCLKLGDAVAHGIGKGGDVGSLRCDEVTVRVA